jgi:hypothetical protein
MSTGGAPERWYVRARGRVLGPLTRAQLQSLRDRGQLARFDQVSQDRQNWIGADRVDRLFPPSVTDGARGSTAPSDEPAEMIMMDDDGSVSGSGTHGSSVADAPEWFFARGGTHQGPVPLTELQRLADSKAIDPETLVWRSGMEQWTPGSWVAELSFSARLPATQGDASTNPAPGATLPPRPGGPSPDRAILATRTSVLAISSLVMGVFWMFGLGSVSAIVLGAMSFRRIARSQGTLTGKRLAVAGMIAGIIGLIVSGLVLRDFLSKGRWQDGP